MLQVIINGAETNMIHLILLFEKNFLKQHSPFLKEREKPKMVKKKIVPTDIGVVVNADLRPEKTVQGELGLQQQIANNMAIDITAYFRDIRDLAGTRSEEISLFGGSASYNKLENSDFAYVRGLVLSLQMREYKGFSGNLDYTFQIAKGSASDPQQARNAIAGGSLPEIQMIALDWDQRNTVNVSLAYD